MHATKRSDGVDPAFEAFVREYSSTLLGAAVLLLKDRGRAEDAVQETLVKTLRHWRRAQHAPEAYSRVVLTNVCRDHWRSKQRRVVEVGESYLEHSAVAPQSDGAQAERIAMSNALAKLSPQHREVLVYRYFLDLSVEETAAAVGIRVGTVKSATQRGLAQLRAVVEAGGEGASFVDE